MLLIRFGISKTFRCIELKASIFNIIVETKSTLNERLVTSRAHKHILFETRCKIEFSCTSMTACVDHTARLLSFQFVCIKIGVAKTLLCPKHLRSV